MLSSATVPAATDPRSEAALARIAVCPGHKGPVGVHADGRWVLRHRGRAWLLRPGVEIADVVDAVECEVCGLVPAALLDVHEYRPDVARVA
jgi:hypothetical protein